MIKNGLFEEINSLRTEQNNPRSRNIDVASTKKILEIINNDDKIVPNAVQMEIPYIEIAVNGIVSSLRNEGRLFYVGAGTSGRLGIVDASECPPTFGTDYDMIQGIIAGGSAAMFKAQEGAEDSFEAGGNALIEAKLSPKDVVCGIAASGRTPFVRGALDYAKSIGCFTIILTTSSREHIESLNINVDVAICPDVGPEVIEGSTRMKSGTAQKLVLNMLTTATMIKLGKTLGNIMVDLQIKNKKLNERAKRIIMRICEVDYDTAEHYLSLANGNVKIALIMILGAIDYDKSLNILASTGGFVRPAIEIAKKMVSNN